METFVPSMIKKFRHASRAYSNYPSVLPILEPTWTIQVYITIYSMLFLTYIPLFWHINGYLYQLSNLSRITNPKRHCPPTSVPPIRESELWTLFSEMSYTKMETNRYCRNTTDTNSPKYVYWNIIQKRKHFLIRYHLDKRISYISERGKLNYGANHTPGG